MSRGHKNITPFSIPAQIDELEALATLMKERAEQVLKNCHKARRLATGYVSTSADHQQVIRMKVVAAQAVSKRNARLFKK